MLAAMPASRAATKTTEPTGTRALVRANLAAFWHTRWSKNWRCGRLESMRRYGLATVFLLGCTLPLALTVKRYYGRAAARRFGAATTAALLAQQVLVGLALKRRLPEGDGTNRHRLSLVDVITLSRGATGALMTGLIASGVRHRRGLAGWLSWIALLYGAIVSDWLDGPIARRLGTSEAGAMFDIEADSWLTLCSSAAAVTWGGLPAYVIAPPLARYVRLATLRRWVPYRQLVSGDPLWTRHIGMAQMMLFIAALAPFGGRATRAIVTIGTPLVVVGQLTTLAYVSWRKLSPRPEVRP